MSIRGSDGALYTGLVRPDYERMKQQIAEAEGCIIELNAEIGKIASKLAAAKAARESNQSFLIPMKRTLEERYTCELKCLQNNQNALPVLQGQVANYQTGIQNHIEADKLLLEKIEKVKEASALASQTYAKTLQDIDSLQQAIDTVKRQAALNEAAIALKQVSVAEMDERLAAMSHEFQKQFAQLEAEHAEKYNQHKETRLYYTKQLIKSQSTVTQLSKAVAVQKSFSSTSSCYTSDGES